MTSMNGARIMQMIDTSEVFNDNIRNFMIDNGLANSGLDYGVVAIIGGQGSGKSTLLNKLFNTQFDTMVAEQGKSKTTQGIWCAKSETSNVLIMDVEGADGREAWDNKKGFENKTALFSMALTDVLMINLWEKEIGRYAAASLPMLKTVFEIHLRLFSKLGGPKPLLLFIVRDFEGRVKKEELHKIIVQDVDHVWTEIIKPDAFANTTVEDCFEIQSVFLPHYLYKTEDWVAEAENLSKRFSDSSRSDFVFLNRNSKIVPAEGFADYTSQLWRTIEKEEDLDLPSQKKMLSQFRCKAKAADQFKKFKDDLETEKFYLDAQDMELKSYTIEESGLLVQRFSEAVKVSVESVINKYLEDTRGYDDEIQSEEKESLAKQCWALLQPIFDAYINAVFISHRAKFSCEMREFLKKDYGECASQWQSFVSSQQSIVLSSFEVQSSGLIPVFSNCSAPNWSLQKVQRQLEDDLIRTARSERSQLVSAVVSASHSTLRRKIAAKLAPILDLSLNDMWVEITNVRCEVLQEEISRLTPIVKELGISEELDKLSGVTTDIVHERVAERAKERSLSDSMFRMFDAAFNRNKTRNWRSWDDVDGIYRKALTKADFVLELFRVSGLPSEYLVGSEPSVFLSSEEVSEISTALRNRAENELAWALHSKAEAATRNMWSMAPWILAIVLGLDNLIWLFSHPFYLFIAILSLGGGLFYYLQSKLGNTGAVQTYFKNEVLKFIASMLPPPNEPISRSSSGESISRSASSS